MKRTVETQCAFVFVADGACCDWVRCRFESISEACLISGQRPGLAPAGEVLSFASPKDKYPKKRRPDCLRPCASLRANLRHAIQSAVRQNSLCAARTAQTRCRKLEHEALALFGANARSLNRVPQAQPDGRDRTAARLVTKLASNPINDCGSCY